VADPGAYPLRLRTLYYCGGENAATRQAFAADSLKAGFGCESQEVVLPIPAITSALLPLWSVDEENGNTLESRTMDVSFLRALNVAEKERVLLVPDTFVRSRQHAEGVGAVPRGRHASPEAQT
jgi:hypothetical protein